MRMVRSVAARFALGARRDRAALLPCARRARPCDACAFVDPPTTYETTEDRQLYLAGDGPRRLRHAVPERLVLLAAIDRDRHARRTASSPDVYVPPTLLKSISWIESVDVAGRGPSAVRRDRPRARLLRLRLRHRAGDQRHDRAARRGQPADGPAGARRDALRLQHRARRGDPHRQVERRAGATARSSASTRTAIRTSSRTGTTRSGATTASPAPAPTAATTRWTRSTAPGRAPRTAAAPRTTASATTAATTRTRSSSTAAPRTRRQVQGQPLWQAVAVTLPDLNNPYWRAPLDLENFQCALQTRWTCPRRSRSTSTRPRAAGLLRPPRRR